MLGLASRRKMMFISRPSTINPATIKRDQRIPLKDIYALYESGKSRRYGLLFSVNGGAFAIVTLLLKDAKVLNNAIIPLSQGQGRLLLGFSAVAMIVFTFLMGMDICNFGMKMRKLGPPLDLFGKGGRIILGVLCFLLIGVWISVLLLSIAQVFYFSC